MKITVRAKEETKTPLVKDLEVGTVFLSAYSKIPVLKLFKNEYLLLHHGPAHNSGLDWLELRNKLLLDPIQKVLGKITEIIVEPL